jgi:hypothetical protein
VFSGAQGYVGLRRKAYRTFVSALPEVLLGWENSNPAVAE